MITAEQLIDEFEQYKKEQRGFLDILQSQIDKVDIIIKHLKICRSCSLGFYCAEHKENNLAEIWNKLIFYPLEYHICNEGSADGK